MKLCTCKKWPDIQAGTLIVLCEKCNGVKPKFRKKKIKSGWLK